MSGVCPIFSKAQRLDGICSSGHNGGMKKINNVQEAIQHLTRLVNWAESSVKQKRLDFNMVSVSEHPFYQEALDMVNQAIAKGELTKDEFKHRLGLD